MPTATEELAEGRIVIHRFPMFREGRNPLLRALRYVLYTHPKRQFSFAVEGEGMILFRDACETYLLHHIGHGYKTLSFYKSVEAL